jgi:NitT/TauT family transport system ATP-binding protein
MEPVNLRMRDVHRVFDNGLEAVASVDLDVPEGKLVALVGPSGCGKTTLLRIAGGIDRPTSGSVERYPATELIGFCFQDPRLLPWRTVMRNVELAPELRGGDARACREAALRALELVGLTDAQALLPHQLSGGMRMRAALARAIVARPASHGTMARPGLLLLDEPFGALDEVTRCQLEEELFRLRQHEGMSALLVTHSIQEAVFLADEVIVLTPRPARVVESFRVPFDARGATLRTLPELAILVGRVHAALRRGMDAAA